MPEVMEAPRVMPGANIEALRAYNETETPRTQADIEAEGKMRELLFGMPAELIQAPYVTLCSIWPERLVSNPFTHGGVARKFYYLEPGSPQKPSYLILQNTFDIIQVQMGIGELGYTPGPILASQLAADLIAHWTGDHPGNRRGKKGVGVIRGKWNGTKIEATSEEIATLEKQQNSFLAFLVERADEYWDGNKREKITGEHRKALKMLGLDEKQHPWFRSKIQQYNSCPECAERILAEAIRCRHCQTSLVKHFTERDLIPSAEQWPGVAREIERMTAKKEKKNV